MPIGVPYDGIYAIKYKDTNGWAAAGEAVGATHGFEPPNPGFMPTPGRQYEDNPAIVGGAGQRLPSKGNLSPANIPLAHALRFEGMVNLAIGLLFGTEALADVTEGTTVVGKQHLFTVHDTLVGINGCLATREKTDDGTTVVNHITEVDSFKTDEVVVSWTQGGRPTLACSLFPRQVLEEGEAAIVNTNTELTAVTVEGSDVDDAPQDAVQVRANGIAASALGSGDVLDCRSLTLTLRRGLAEADPVSSSAGVRIEPVPTARNGIDATLQLTFADQQARSFWRNHRDGDRMKADVLFSGGLLVGAATEIYKHQIALPAMVIPDFQRPRGNRLGEQLTLQGGRPTAVSAGMTDSVNPHWFLVNERTTAYLV